MKKFAIVVGVVSFILLATPIFFRIFRMNLLFGIVLVGAIGLILAGLIMYYSNEKEENYDDHDKEHH